MNKRKAEQAAALEEMRQSFGIIGVVKQKEFNVHSVQEEQAVQNAPGVHDVLQAQEEQRTQGRAGMKASRINMAFKPSNLDYLHKIAGIKQVSLTAYVNSLIEADRKLREEELDRVLSQIK